jgi:uncharacterized protein YcbK (DUF882 family)
MQLTKNFNLNEFQCKCGCEMPEFVKKNIEELAKDLQVIRDKVGVGFTPNSAYRCPKHNTIIGGVKTSQHLKGKAADIKIKGIEPSEVADLVEDLMKTEAITKGGVGRYNSFTHVDIRGTNARWDFTNKK